MMVFSMNLISCSYEMELSDQKSFFQCNKANEFV